MIGIIRYLKGYVKIRVWGYSPERFMNLCKSRGIVLWGLAGYGGYYTMYISLSDFFTIRDIVKKTRTRVAVLEKRGLPFFMRDMKKRKVFAAGIFVCLAFLLWMSRFVWAIDLEGNLRITDDELIDFLKENGVDYGVQKSGIDIGTLEEAIREEFSLITWTSVHLEGTKLSVSIKENDLPTKEELLDGAKGYPNGADMFAQKDGTVISILTRSGIPKVKAGDHIEKGTLLIGGLVPVTNDDGTVRQWEGVIADGDVVLECKEPVALTQKLFYQYKNYTGKEKRYRFFTWNGKEYRFPFQKCGYLKFDVVSEKKRLRILGQIDLPVFYGTMRCREYLPVDAVYETEAAKRLLSGRLQKIITQLEEKGVQIVEKDVTIGKGTDFLVLEGNLTVRQKAVYLKPAKLPEEETSDGTGQR